MILLALIGGFVAFCLLVTGHAFLAVLMYVAAGAAWVRHDRGRPLEELPPWVSGGRLVAGLIWTLWPVRAAEAALAWKRRLREPERFAVGPARQAQAFGSWDEAIASARSLAGESGEPVPVTDRARLVRHGSPLTGPRQHWTGLVAPDGSVERRPSWFATW